MCVCMCAHVRTPGWRDWGGEGQAVPRGEDRLVLTALRGEMPKEGLGGGCPLRHTASQRSRTTTETTATTPIVTNLDIVIRH